MKKDNKQLFLNLLSSILAFFINTGIQFVVTPIISKNIGDEAYGFITIANDFINYAGIFAVVLNSVSARFISIEIHQKNIVKAEEYYNSVFVGNIIISSIIAFFGVVVVFSFDKFLEISPELIPDVSILFAITFIYYILSVMISLFTVSVYVKNRIDLASIRNIISYLIKLIVVVLLFVFASKIRVYFLAVATLASTIFLGFANARITKKIMPEVKLRSKRFRIRLIGVLLKTGVWMSINNLSNVIANSFTAIIINRNIGSDKAGFYSVSRTIPNAATSFIYAIYSVFVPKYYKLYAENKKSELVNYGISSMKLMTFIVSVPLIVLCIKSKEFLTLWQSYRSHDEIINMSALFSISLLLCICYLSVLSISQLGLVANKVKIQMVNNIFISCSTLLVTYLSIKLTDWDLLGVALGTLVVQGLKWIFFTPVYAAYVIDAPRFVFFKQNIVIIICEVVVFGVLFFMGSIIHCASWMSFVICVLGFCLLGWFLLFFLLFSKEEKKTVLGICKSLIQKIV